MYMSCLFRHEWYAITLSDLFGLQESSIVSRFDSFVQGEQIVDYTHNLVSFELIQIFNSFILYNLYGIIKTQTH